MNQDYLGRMPNQNIEQRATECVGETIADIIGNIVKTPCDAGFNYAAALKVANTTPTTAGSDPYSGALGGIVYGALPTSKEAFDATTTSELYEANLANYDRILAIGAQNGLTPLYTYEDIVIYLEQGIGGVILPITFYSSFLGASSAGVLPIPTGTTTKHCTAVYEVTEAGLRAKFWLGPDYGDGGYIYIPEALFLNIFAVAAWGFNPLASRYWSLATTGLTHWNVAGDCLAAMKS